MIDVSAVLAFSLAAGLLTITPGLDTALVLRTAAVEGAWPARFAAFGICAGCLTWGLATALGLTALLTLSRAAYEIVRIAGACYLILLGIQMWFGRRNVSDEIEPAERDLTGEQPGNNARKWLVRGLLTNLLNPKVGIFYMTLLPQFVPLGGNVGLYCSIFTLIHVTEGLLWLTLLSMTVRPLRSWLVRPRVKRGLDCTTGTILIGSGLAVAFERRR